MLDLLSRTWGAAAVPLTILLTTLWNRKHVNEIEDTRSQSEAMVAITDANTQLTKLMTAALEPLQEQITYQKNQLDEHKSRSRQELDLHQKQIDAQRIQLTHFYAWVRNLRRQILENGITPVDPPPELDLDGFSFD